MKAILLSQSVVLLILFCGVTVFSQQVRLRSQLTPACTVVAGSPSWKFSDITADGNIAVQGSYSCRGAFIYDITNPDKPVLANWYNPGGNQQFLEAIVIGNRAYFGSGNISTGVGVHIVDVTNPYQPVLLGTVDPTHGNGNVSVHEMMVIDQAGKRYLIENFNSTTIDKNIKIIDVTNPSVPVFKWAFAPADGSWVHAMHIRGNRMFTSEFTGAKVEIFDISNLATQSPTSIGAVVANNTTNHSSWTSEDGRYLYSARETQDGDLRVYDIQNPASPVLVRIVKAADLNLNAITPHNPIVMGNKLYVSWYQAGVQVFDISNPTNPVRIGQYDTFPSMFVPPSENSLSLRENEPWDIICGGSNLQNSLPTNYDGNWTAYPFLGEDKIIAGDLAAGLLILDATGLNSAPKNVVSDFDGDRKTDFSVFNPTTGVWTIEASTNGSQFPINWGATADIPVAGDFDGDGKADAAVWRPSNGHWYVTKSSGGGFEVGWGLPGDIPVEGDFDADGRTDTSIWRPSEGTWYIWQSTLGIWIQPWGVNGDKPVVGDFDGDGKSDLGIWRPSNGTWYVLLTSSSQMIIITWGVSGDMPLITDFDGNKRSEFTIFRPSDGSWWRMDPLTGSISMQTFGTSGDQPIPADYDGDGKTDIAVFRPSNNTWYRIDSGDWVYRVRAFGQSGEFPSPASVQPE